MKYGLSGFERKRSKIDGRITERQSGGWQSSKYIPFRYRARYMLNPEPNLPDSWRVITDQWDSPQEYNPQSQPLVRFEHEVLDVWVSIEHRDPNEGRPRDYVHYQITVGLNAESGDDPSLWEGNEPAKWRQSTEMSHDSSEEAFENARVAARYFVHRFEEYYEQNKRETDSFDYAIEQIEEQHNTDFS